MACPHDQTYDYVIVGGGTSGALMAKMLSDDCKTSVLLLEAGSNYDYEPDIRDPARANALDSDLNYKYFWQGEAAPVESNGITYHWPGGRLLGGCSSINGLQYVKGTAGYYRKWEDLLGCEWSVAKIMKAYDELETYHGKTNGIRGEKGPIDVTQVPIFPPDMNTKMVNALVKISGVPKIVDYNDVSTPLGVFSGWQLSMTEKFERVSSSTAFLNKKVVDSDGKGVCGRKLTVSTKSTVSRILFSEEEECTHSKHSRCKGCGKRKVLHVAMGVYYIHNGIGNIAKARRRVIVSAGVRSAELLMHSGIGPRENLEEVGVKVLVDNPLVGQGLVNQIVTSAVFKVNPDDVPYNTPKEIYTSGAFLPDPSIPDPSRKIQFIGLYTPEAEPSLSSPGNPALLAVAMIPLDPKSRGDVKLISKDPLAMPQVNFNYFNDPADLATCVSIYKTYIKKLNTYVTSTPGYEGYALIEPSPELLEDGAEEELQRYIVTTMQPTHHNSCTLRMALEKSEGVVDEHGEVFGVRHLTVADDLILPFINDGNTQSTAYLVGYMIAKYLIARYQ